MESNIDKLKYSIGKFKTPKNVDEQKSQDWIKTIHALATDLKTEVMELSEDDLQKKI